jgi:CubicO group peptidase (beta-lactamase class C family)
MNRVHRPSELRFAVVLLGAVSLSSSCGSHTDPIDQFIQGVMSRAKVPGIAVAIVRHGRIVRAQGYGMANLEHQVPVRSTTVFQSGSIGKVFTAAEILLLVQDGKLALDDPISKYLDGTPAEWRSITIRHLLTHTSGLPDYGEDSTWLDLRRDYSEDELLRIIASHPLLRAPGQEWIYSNAGYTLLGMIIRSVTGAHWGVFLKQRIFDPLGMETARVISEEDIVPNRAAGYRVVDGEVKNQEWVAPGQNTVAEGALYLSVLDLAKWDAALYGDSLFARATKGLMWSPTRLNDGRMVSYGLGWFLQEEPGRRAVEHDGEWQGFRSWLGRFLDDSLTVIVLGNSNSAAFLPDLVGHRIAALVDPALAPPVRTPIHLSPEALAEYAGQYRLPSGLRFQFRVAADGLDLSIGGQPVARVLPASKDVFFAPAFPIATFLFVRDSSGTISWLFPKRTPSRPERAERIRE